MAHEITISWDKSPSTGATYNVYRGTAPGNEAAVPYATGITNPPPISLTGVVAGPSAVYTGLVNGAPDAFQGMSVTIKGFNSPNNNGTFKVISSDATTLTVNNGNANTESSPFINPTAQLPPYFIDNAVLPGNLYSYEITAVVGGVQSLDSVEVLASAVPFDQTPEPIALDGLRSFVVLAGTTITNTGTTTVDGDIGVSPGTSITGMGSPSVVAGVIHSNDFVAIAAQASLTTAFEAGMALAPTLALSASSWELGGTVLGPGVYSIGSSAAITGQFVLDAHGNPDAVFIFQIGSTLTTASSNSTMVLANNAQAGNVFFLVGSSATLNDHTFFFGNILAQTSITVGANVSIFGRLLARTGAVTLINDNVLLSISANLQTYATNTSFLFGEVIFDCASGSWQQVFQGGTTGNVKPVFTNVFGHVVQDGSVFWVTLDPKLIQIVTPLPPSPPNIAPPPPLPPQNPRVSSDV